MAEPDKKKALDSENLPPPDMIPGKKKNRDLLLESLLFLSLHFLPFLYEDKGGFVLGD